MLMPNTRLFRFVVFATVCVFTITLISGCDRKEFGVVKPSETDFILIDVRSTDTDVAMVLANQEGEQLIVLADKTSDGQIATVTGGAYATPSGETFTFWFGNDGLPEYAVTENWMFRLYNYTSNTVDIIGIDPSGNWHHWLDVDIEASTLGSLRGVVARGSVRFSSIVLGQIPSAGKVLNSSSQMGCSQQAQLVNAVSLALSIAACGISIATLTTGISAFLAGLTCGSAIMGVARVITEGDFCGDSGGSMAIAAVTCAAQDPLGCIGLGLDLLAFNIDENTEVRDDRSELTEFQRRITLTWGENPRDLDSHLWTPSIGGRSYHVYFSSKGSENSPPYAELDVDDVSSYGPENITIKQLYAGTYYYSVYHYSGSGTITSSGAIVKVLGSQGEVLRSLNVPSGSAGSNWWWNVLSINGSTGAITIINQISSSPPSGTSSPNQPWDAPKNVE